MPTAVWRGDAQKVAQVTTITVADTWATGDTATVTINGKDLVVTVGSTVTTDEVAKIIQLMIAGSAASDDETRSALGTSFAEFSELTATVDGSVVTLTGADTGEPFVVSVTANTAGSGSLTLSTTTFGTGPNHWNDAENWSTGDVPGYGDDVVVPEGAAIKWGLRHVDTVTAANGDNTLSPANTPFDFRDGQKVRVENSGGALPTGLSDSTTYYVVNADPDAGTLQLSTSEGGAAETFSDDGTGTHTLYTLLKSLAFPQAFTNDTGLPRVHPNTSLGGYVEYRTQKLVIGATTLTVGEGEGRGSSRLRISTSSYQTTLNVYSTGQAASDGRKPVQWDGTHASNVVNVTKGGVDVAAEPGDTATVATLRVGYRDDPAGDSDVRLSDGVTLTTVNQSGGTVEWDGDVTTVNQSGGTSIARSGDVTTLDLDGGTHLYRGSGTLATVSVGSSGVLDFSQDMQGRTITNLVNVYKGARVLDPFATVTFTGDLKVNGAGLQDVTLELGVDRTVGVS